MHEHIDEEEIWKWHCIILDCENSGMIRRDYCRLHNLSYMIFTARKRIIYSHKASKPQKYEKDLMLYNEYKKLFITQNDFCKQQHVKLQNFKVHDLKHMMDHVRALEVIQNFKEEGRALTPAPGNDMKFLELKSEKELKKIKQQEQVYEKVVNDMEIKISDGIIVKIAPYVATEAILKIIQLLRNL